MKQVYENLRDLVKSWFSVNDDTAMYLLIGAAVIVVLIIILVTFLIVKGIKKSKAKKNTKVIENINPSNDENKVEEKQEILKEEVVKVEEKTENGKKPDTKVVENTKNKELKKATKVETKPVEEVKEENKEEVKVEAEKTTRIALGKYEVFPVNDLFLYRLKASNGEIMVISEIYKTKNGAISAVETVKKSVDNGELQISCDKHGYWQFKLFAANKRLLVASANYASQQGCESAANSFKKFAKISPVVVLDEDTDHIMEEINLDAIADKKGGKLVVSCEDNEFDFKLCASNGVVLCSSNTFKTKAATLGSINTIQEAIKTGRFFVVKDKNDMYQFKLYNSQLRCVIIGEAYKAKSQAVSSANSVSSFIKLAEIVDKTIETVTE